ncbi:antihemorrhagic factor cHLP-B-like protein [Labeo rohita]|uniref:Antihemorrhagic factor cHLP-B-like protein n=1 Tax=Labeo rohita TaxID=84645 RepID=A0A498N6B3_LABRO|nr:antihemorrhagic factor cHLP-B-like protein [Labeo rohita]
MRELVILAALVSALHGASLPAETDVEYKCQKDQDKIATLEAERFINGHHRHGYKFKFVSQDSRSADEKKDPCDVILGITLEETECHIVNPKPLDQCKARMESETKVTAKCNVTISSVEGKAAVKRYICDTEPGSHEMLVKKCPDCPSLLPLHDPKALESVKTALQKFNKQSNHKSYFKLMEVGRISTQWMFSGQSYFAQFAIMETNCTNKEAPQKEEACKALCWDQARYGFCKSSKVGTEEPEVECELYEAQDINQDITQNMQGMTTKIKYLVIGGVQNSEAMTTRTKHLTRGAVQNTQAMTTRTKHLTRGAVQNTQAMTTRTKHLTRGAAQNTQAMTTRTKHLTGGAIQNMQAMIPRTKNMITGAVQNTQAMIPRTKSLTTGDPQNIHISVQEALQEFQNQHLKPAMSSHAMAL